MSSTVGRRARWWLTAATVALLVAACGAAGTASDGEVAGPDHAAGAVSGELLVFAAASLTDAFEALREAFVTTHPDVEVVLNLAGSQTLASQISEGAPADVFSSANVTQLDAVAAATSLASAPRVLTTNRLAIAVEAGNPLGIGRLEDLADPDLLLVLPAEAVPAGRYAREALDAAGVQLTPVSLERDVRAALARVELGEADAAIVYASDLATSDAAEAVAIPASQNVTATYPIAVLDDAPNPVAAAAFVTFALGAEGQAILAAHGFVSP